MDAGSQRGIAREAHGYSPLAMPVVDRFPAMVNLLSLCSPLALNLVPHYPKKIKNDHADFDEFAFFAPPGEKFNASFFEFAAARVFCAGNDCSRGR